MPNPLAKPRRRSFSRSRGWRRVLPWLGLLGLLAGLGVALAIPTATPVPLTDQLAAGHRALRMLDLVEARKVASSLVPTAQADPSARYFLARLAFYEGQYDKALKWLEGVNYLGPDGKKDDFPELVRRVSQATTGLSYKDSQHFRVFYQADGPDRILVDYALETLEKAVAVLSAELEYTPPERMRVEIYPDSKRFIAASGLTAGEIETTGTVALCVYNKLMITSPRALALGYRWMDTLSHELVHLLVAQRTRNETPVWLQEGLARFFEVRWRGGRGADMELTSQSLLAEALKADKLVPFERMSPSLAKLPSAEEAQLAFAQVQTVIEFILSRKGLDGVHKLLESLSRGMTDRESMSAVLGVPFETFQDQWKVFVKGKRLRAIPGLTVLPTILKAQEVAEGRAEADEKVADPYMARYKTLRDYSRLGDLLRQRGRFKAALIEYGKARSSTPVESPALSVKIAMTYMEGRNFAEARAVLEAAAQRYPSFAPTFTTLAVVQLAADQKAEALKNLLEANAINPFDPFVHRSLQDLYQVLGRRSEAAREEQVLQALWSRG